jgi:hypothetical protein
VIAVSLQLFDFIRAPSANLSAAVEDKKMAIRCRCFPVYHITLDNLGSTSN